MIDTFKEEIEQDIEVVMENEQPQTPETRHKKKKAILHIATIILILGFLLWKKII